MEAQRRRERQLSNTSVMKVLHWHRVVKNYVEQDSLRELLRSRTGPKTCNECNPYLAILGSYISLITVLLDFEQMHCYNLTVLSRRSRMEQTRMTLLIQALLDEIDVEIPN